MNVFREIFLWHLRRERTRMVVLALCCGAFVALLFSISNSIRPAEVQAFMERMPAGMRALIGLAEGEVFDFTRWVGVIFNHPVWLVATLSFPVAAALRGVARGVEDGTLEVVLAQPVGRGAYYLALACVVALGVTLCLAGTFGGALAARALVELPGEIRTAKLVELTLSGWALAVAVGGIALLVSVAGAGGGRAGTVLLGIVVGMFFLRFLADVLPALKWLRWLSVFGYHDPGAVVGSGLRPVLSLALVAVGAAAGALGLVAFRRKELSF